MSESYDLITAEQVREVLEARVESNITLRWTLRECSMCGAALQYYFTPSLHRIVYDSNCDCVTYYSDLQPVSMPRFLETFNRQDPRIRYEMWTDFVATIRTQQGISDA